MRVEQLQSRLEAADKMVEILKDKGPDAARFAREQRDLVVDQLHAELDVEATVRRVSTEAFAAFVEALTQLSMTRQLVRQARGATR